MAFRISDALQVQFWVNGIQTFNEFEPPFPVFKHCFYQRFLASDNIKIQFKDDTGLNYSLQFFDDEGTAGTLVAIPEVAEGVYELVFQGVTYGFIDTYIQIKILQGTIIGSTTTETSIELDEFTSDMEGWTNVVKPVTTLQDLADFQQVNNSIVPGGLGQAWTLITSKPNVTLLGGGDVSKWAYIELNGLKEFSYLIDFRVDFDNTFSDPVSYDLQFIALDSLFNPYIVAIVSDVFASVPGFTSGSFLIPSGVFDVKYLSLKVIDNTGSVGSSYTWTTATLEIPPVADWAWSADDSGCLKLTTVDASDTSKVIKAFTLPQENHYLRIKWQIVFPPSTINFTLLVYILDASNTVLFGQVLASPLSISEQTFNQFINASIYLTAAYIRIEAYDPSGTFVAGDIIKINSVEIYTSATTYITSTVERAKSDLINFANSLIDIVPIYYKSAKNFAGLVYNSISPYNILRLPGLFFKESKVTEQMSLDLSNSKDIDTASQVKIKKELLIDDMTDYMHLKTILALQHAVSGSVVINNVEWTWDSGDSYEEIESDPTYPFTNAKIKLTRKNYVVTNVI